jgi:Tfp pilus assembly protein PilF
MRHANVLLACGFLLSFTAGQAAAVPPGATQTQSSTDSGVQFTTSHAPGETVPPELAAAEDKIEAKDYTGARPLVAQYLSAHPDDARALFDLGYMDEDSRDDDAAVAEYRRAIAADPKQFESRLALGLLLLQQGKPDEAREQLQQATALQSSAPTPEAQAEALRGLAEAERNSDPKAARDALLAALKLSPETPKDLLLTAQIAEASGDSDSAAQGYRRLLADPSAPDRLVFSAAAGMAQILLQQQKYSDAEAVLRGALTRDPGEPTLNSQLAAALIAQGKSRDALDPLQKVHDRQPQNSAVNQLLADAYVESGHPEKADPIFVAMAQQRPDDPILLSEQGQNLINEEQYAQAQKVLEHAVEVQPNDGDAWENLAVAASGNKQYARALQALTMRAKYLPESAPTYFLRAVAYDNLHNNLAAERSYRKFLTASAGQFPDQERRARERLAALSRSR